MKYYYKLKEPFPICFSASLFQSSESRDPSEIIIICWFTAQGILIIITIKQLCCFFLEFMIIVSGFFEKDSKKKKAFIWYIHQSILYFFRKVSLRFKEISVIRRNDRGGAGRGRAGQGRAGQGRAASTGNIRWRTGTELQTQGDYKGSKWGG